eukprot:CAMPEP_0179136860 /NCGR_PEP_ID=MMETSP0796-20121207/65245_1 /TAXON_ID=73915 /ORGANISM="Pyrodinium bahamense, Strain pbaha01" /LENGTH=106 /DNA_ID=CAMNT_0020835979 /DNA_START=12 /DNA_END=330 /DNA_ORIENTATION=+
MTKPLHRAAVRSAILLADAVRPGAWSSAFHGAASQAASATPQRHRRSVQARRLRDVHLAGPWPLYFFSAPCWGRQQRAPYPWAPQSRGASVRARAAGPRRTEPSAG